MSSPAVNRSAEGIVSTNQNDILRVLAGEADYDDLAGRDQTVVRASSEETMAERLAHLGRV